MRAFSEGLVDLLRDGQPQHPALLPRRFAWLGAFDWPVLFAVHATSPSDAQQFLRAVLDGDCCRRRNWAARCLT